MNCKLPAIVLLALCPICCLAQREVRSARTGSTLVAQLVEEIAVLQRVVPLQLTDAQLDQILALYTQHPLPENEAVRKLQAMKQGLLTGTLLVATDLKTLRQLGQEAARRARDPQAAAAPGEDALTLLEQAIWGLLTMTQRAALLGDVRGPAADNQKGSIQVGQRALAQIGQVLHVDEGRWPETRDRLAGALSAAAAQPQRDNCRQMLADFLDRLRKMAPADFAARQTELVAELLALLPPGTNLVVAMAEHNPKLIQRAVSASLAHPRAAGLVEHIKLARVRAQAQ